MIKYLGSKRTLVSVLGDIAQRVEARTAVDLFTGTTRVAQELKERGVHVTATDVATYRPCSVTASSRPTRLPWTSRSSTTS